MFTTWCKSNDCKNIKQKTKTNDRKHKLKKGKHELLVKEIQCIRLHFTSDSMLYKTIQQHAFGHTSFIVKLQWTFCKKENKTCTLRA